MTENDDHTPTVFYRLHGTDCNMEAKLVTRRKTFL